MAGATVAMAVASSVLQAYGMYQQGQAADAAGQQAQLNANAEAKQMEANAKAEAASAQRKMIEERKQGDLVKSRAQALTAASGGGSLDPSIIDVMGDLEADIDYNVKSAKFEGDTAASDLNYGAKVRRQSGEVARSAGKLQKRSATIGAAGSVLKSGFDIGTSDSFQTLSEKYGWQ